MSANAFALVLPLLLLPFASSQQACFRLAVPIVTGYCNGFTPAFITRCAANQSASSTLLVQLVANIQSQRTVNVNNAVTAFCSNNGGSGGAISDRYVFCDTFWFRPQNCLVDSECAPRPLPCCSYCSAVYAAAFAGFGCAGTFTPTGAGGSCVDGASCSNNVPCLSAAPLRGGGLVLCFALSLSALLYVMLLA